MSEIEKFIEEYKDKASKIPNLPMKIFDTWITLLVRTTNENRQRKLMDMIRKFVDRAYHTHVINSKKIPVLSFPNKEEASNGFLKIGDVKAGKEVLYPFMLSAEDLRQHVLITARSGFGKSTLLFNIIDELIEKEIDFVVFDFKRDGRSLLKKFPNLKIIRAKQVRFNPLFNIPENCDAKEWRRQVFRIFSFSQGLFQATTSHMLRTIDDLNNDKGGAITFKELLEFLLANIETSRKNMEYADIAVNRLFNLTNAMGEVLTCKVGWDIKQLFSDQVIIEVDGWDFPTVSFFSQCLLMWEFMRRLKNNVRNNEKCTYNQWFKDNHVEVIMTEAHNMHGQENSYVTNELGDDPLSQIISQVRETGMGFLCESQFYGKIASSMKLNCATKIVGGTEEVKVQKEIADSIGMDKDGYKILGRVEKGNWICNVAGRTKPFVMGSLAYAKGELVADAEVIARSKPFINFLEEGRNVIESNRFMSQLEKKEKETRLPDLSKDSWKVFEFIAEHWWMYQDQIQKGVGFGVGRFANAKNMLKRKSLIVEHRFVVKKNERVFYAITEYGRMVLRILGKSEKLLGYWRKLTEDTSYQHNWWTNMYGYTYVNVMGWEGHKEHTFKNGRRVDLVVNFDGYIRGIEVELTTTDFESKISVVKENLVSDLVMAYCDDHVLQRVIAKYEKLDEELKKRIWVGNVRDYLKILDENIIRASEKNGNNQNSKNSAHEDKEERNRNGNDGESE